MRVSILCLQRVCGMLPYSIISSAQSWICANNTIMLTYLVNDTWYYDGACNNLFLCYSAVIQHFRPTRVSV